ncbi:hypothetical protein [Halorhabdus rudnickae]|uniref:hypothetical protein n=1 Tax=Halorhabdus rudnickae TaxID=1775544 RepID=UPI0010826575|nr:hypothetical protein [Halorhabdus rudnickae]
MSPDTGFGANPQMAVTAAVASILILGLVFAGPALAASGDLEVSVSIPNNEGEVWTATQEPFNIDVTAEMPEFSGEADLTLTLYVRGDEKDSKTITVEGGQSLSESFTYTFTSSPDNPVDNPVDVEVEGELTADGDTFSNSDTVPVHVTQSYVPESPFPERLNVPDDLVYDDTINGINASNAYNLFGLDRVNHSNPLVRGGVNWNLTGNVSFENMSAENKSVFLKAYANAADITYPGFPPFVPTWNANNWDDFSGSFSSGTDRSFNADLGVGGGAVIKHAGVSMFNIEESVTLFRSNNPSGRIRYIPEESTIRGTADYRIEVPEGTDRVGYEESYSLDGSSVSQVCVVAGSGSSCSSGSEVGSTGGSKFFEVDYDMGSRDPDEIQLVAEFSANIEKTVRDRYQVCHNGSCHYEWSTTTTHQSYSATASETISVEVRDEVRALVDRRVLPNGKVGFDVQFEPASGDVPVAMWSNMSINNSRVLSGWEFTTWRNTNWDSLRRFNESTEMSYGPDCERTFSNGSLDEGDKPGEIVNQDDDSTTFHKDGCWPAHVKRPSVPIRTYGFPVSEPYAYQGEEIYVRHVRHDSPHGTLSSPEPQLPGAVDVAVVNNSYQPATGVAVVYNGKIPPNESAYESSRDYPPGEITVDDIEFRTFPPSAPTEVEEVGDQTEVQETELVASVVDEREDELDVAVHLEEADSGDPIQLPSDDGYIQLNRGEFSDEEFRTNSDGNVTVTVPAKYTGNLHFEYVPEDWWNASASEVAYAGSETRVSLGFGVGAEGLIVRLLNIIWLPAALLLTMYGLFKRDVIMKYI